MSGSSESVAAESVTPVTPSISDYFPKCLQVSGPTDHHRPRHSRREAICSSLRKVINSCHASNYPCSDEAFRSAVLLPWVSSWVGNIRNIYYIAITGNLNHFHPSGRSWVRGHLRDGICSYIRTYCKPKVRRSRDTVQWRCMCRTSRDDHRVFSWPYLWSPFEPCSDPCICCNSTLPMDPGPRVYPSPGLWFPLRVVCHQRDLSSNHVKRCYSSFHWLRSSFCTWGHHHLQLNACDCICGNRHPCST